MKLRVILPLVQRDGSNSNAVVWIEHASKAPCDEHIFFTENNRRSCAVDGPTILYLDYVVVNNPRKQLGGSKSVAISHRQMYKNGVFAEEWQFGLGQKCPRHDTLSNLLLQNL